MPKSRFLAQLTVFLAVGLGPAWAAPPEGTIEIGKTEAGAPLLRLGGLPGQYFRLESSSDLETWVERGRNTFATDEFHYEDTTAHEDSLRFYLWHSLNSPGFECTQAIGFSQVGSMAGGWFVAGGAFESAVDGDRWQLLWNGGAGVDRWQDPSYPGWNNALVSPCATGSSSPDRVLLVISGPYGTDEPAWVAAIDATIETITSKLPDAGRIVLQPVVGGPDHATCIHQGSGNEVRASWQHAHIDNAIETVVAQRFGTDPEVTVGLSPEVRTCDDYVDMLGHLSSGAATAIGASIGEYYAATDQVGFQP